MASLRAPGPKGRLLSGNLHYWRRDRLAYMTWCARTYCDYVALRFGHRRIATGTIGHMDGKHHAGLIHGQKAGNP